MKKYPRSFSLWVLVAFTQNSGYRFLFLDNTPAPLSHSVAGGGGNI